MTAQLPSRELLQKIIETANEIITVSNGTNGDIWENDTATIVSLYDQLNDNLASPSVVKALAEFALAAREQEPVAWIIEDEGNGIPQHISSVKEYALAYPERKVTPLYAHPAPVPAVPDGYVLMPMKLTAENGAKYALSGEFHVLHRVTCNECGGEGCSDCDDDGWLEEKIMIGWDDIKDIYRAAVEACSIKSTGEGV